MWECHFQSVPLVYLFCIPWCKDWLRHLMHMGKYLTVDLINFSASVKQRNRVFTGQLLQSLPYFLFVLLCLYVLKFVFVSGLTFNDFANTEPRPNVGGLVWLNVCYFQTAVKWLIAADIRFRLNTFFRNQEEAEDKYNQPSYQLLQPSLENAPWTGYSCRNWTHPVPLQLLMCVCAREGVRARNKERLIFSCGCFFSFQVFIHSCR